MERLRALSVQNPWGWALVQHRPGRGPLKPVENRTSPLGVRNIGRWTLIHVGHSHTPDEIAVAVLRELVEPMGLKVPDWATLSRRKHKIGVIIGAVRFTADARPQYAELDPYARLWVTPQSETPDRRRCWMLDRSIAFPEDLWIESKGTQAPLVWETSAAVHEKAQALLTRFVP